MRCKDLLQDEDNGLQRKVVKTFALDPSRLVIDYDVIDFFMQFKQVDRMSLPRAKLE